jgi:hypothetical protein
VIAEFRAIYAASSLSWIGDYIARAAITALVFQLTHSAIASAAAFALSYAPWLLGGSVLVSLADRYPYRTVMVFCDVARMVVMAVLALVPMKLPLELVLILCSALFAPPFDAARSALLPSILPGDRYVVGIGLHSATAQPAQVVGYFVGASLAAVNPRMALLVNAATFAASALLVWFRVTPRPAASDPSRRSDLLRETGDGFRLVFASPALRSIVLLVFCGSVFAVVPEGLGAAWAAQLATPSARGWAQGLIMAVIPLGAILGALTVTRLVPPDTRRRLLRPLAVLIPLAMCPAIFSPPVAGVALLSGLCGFGMGALVPIANSQFVLALPNGYRARAFGVVQGGLQLLQGSAVLATGALTQAGSVPLVVGLWSLAGVVLMLLLTLSWPAPQVFADAVASAAALNAEPPPNYAPRQGGDSAPGDPATGNATPVDSAPVESSINDPGNGEAGVGEAGNGTRDGITRDSGQEHPAHNGRGHVTGAARSQSASGQPGTMEP